MQTEVVLLIIKLVVGGIAAFLAIMLWSRTRDAAWMCLVAGIVTSYAGIVYDMLVQLGIVVSGGITVAAIPIATLLFAVVPTLFYIFALILMLVRSR